MPCLMGAPTVHLHVSRRCNLACTHCYTRSGPSQTESLPFGHILGALRPLRAFGYETLAISGGEPFLYPDISDLLRAAKAAGFRTSVITNGITASAPMLASIRRDVDSIAISFDGTRAHHNRMRNRKDAFERAERTAGQLAALDIPFSIATTLSRGRVTDVVDLYEMARGIGAAAVQVTPIVAVGRGQDASVVPMHLDAQEREDLMLTAAVLSTGKSGPPVSVELFSTCALTQAKAQFRLLQDGCEDAPLSDLINPLVILPDGGISPFAYGLARQYDLGRLGDDMSRSIRAWRKNGLMPLRDLVDGTFERIAARPRDFVDWYSDIVAHSRADGRRAKPSAGGGELRP